MNGLYGNRILLFRAFLRARLLFPREKHVYFSQCSIVLLLYAISLVSNEKKKKNDRNRIELNSQSERRRKNRKNIWTGKLEINFRNYFFFFFFFYDKFCDTSYFFNISKVSIQKFRSLNYKQMDKARQKSERIDSVTKIELVLSYLYLASSNANLNRL